MYYGITVLVTAIVLKLYVKVNIYKLSKLPNYREYKLYQCFTQALFTFYISPFTRLTIGCCTCNQHFHWLQVWLGGSICKGEGVRVTKDSELTVRHP